MDIYLIDYWAQSGQSRWHQASALAKISGTALTIAAVVLSGDVFVLVAIYLLLAAVVAGTRLGTRRILLRHHWKPSAAMMSQRYSGLPQRCPVALK